MNRLPTPTMEEEEALGIVRNILDGIIDPSRITSGCRKSYLPILLDGNSRRTICRFYLRNHAYIGTISERKVEVKNRIECARDIRRFTSDIRTIIKKYLEL